MFAPPFMTTSKKALGHAIVTDDSTFFRGALPRTVSGAGLAQEFFLSVFAAVAVKLPVRAGHSPFPDHVRSSDLELSSGVAFFAIKRRDNSENTTPFKGVKQLFSVDRICTNSGK
jgi:hypothetical protein